MIKLKDLVPTNLKQEKEKFFQDQNYNPQFTYETKIDETDLNYYGLPQKKYLDLAQAIIDQSFFKRTETDILNLEGKEVSQNLVDQKIRNFLRQHQLENKFDVIWSETFFNSVSFNPKVLKMHSPCKLRDQELTSLLYHEIGTHVLRQVNYEQQIWFKKKKKNGFKPHLQTEEGLATFHSLLGHNFKLAYKSALRYLTVNFALQHSFQETWQFLLPYIDNPEKRWLFTLRSKRGVTDTSKPGSFTKDLVYLEGLVTVYQYLHSVNFNINKIYYGKISWEDADKAYQLNPNYQVILPSFFSQSPEKYKNDLLEIAKINYLDSIKML